MLGTAEIVVLSGLTGERWGVHKVSDRLRRRRLAQVLTTITMLHRLLLKGGITDVSTQQQRMVKRSYDLHECKGQMSHLNCAKLYGQLSRQISGGARVRQGSAVTHERLDRDESHFWT